MLDFEAIKPLPWGFEKWPKNNSSIDMLVAATTLSTVYAGCDYLLGATTFWIITVDENWNETCNYTGLSIFLIKS